MTKPSRPVRRAAFFDLDKTVIAKSSTLAFSRPFYAGGLISRRSLLRSTYAQFVFLLGRVGHRHMERMRVYLSELAAGLDVQTVKDIVDETLHHVVDPLVYAEAVTLIEQHHQLGHDVVVVSTSGAEMVEPIGAMLGADHVIATTMEQRDGRYTGKIAFYAYAEQKAEAIRNLAEREGYDLAASYAYSDSATDLPMLEVVGRPYAVNPDRTLRRLATERGWPVVDFDTPVQLRRTGRLAAKPGVLAGFATAVVVVAGTGVVVIQRRGLLVQPRPRWRARWH